MGACVTLVLAVGAGLCLIAFVLKNLLLGIYSTDPDVIAAGLIRLSVFATTYYLCGLMDVLCGVIRGMGAAIAPMIVSIVGACGFRIFWIYAVLPLHPTLTMLYIGYPVSWILTAAAHMICYLKLIRRFPPGLNEEE